MRAKAEPDGKLNPDQGELGVSGTVLLNGYLQTGDKSELQREGGYGRLQTWGAFEEMRRTCPGAQVAMEMTVAPIRDASLEVEPVDDSKLEIDKADYVRDNLTHWLQPRWGTFAERCVDTFLTFGFNIDEPVHGVRDDDRVPGGKAFYVRKLAHRLPSSLTQTPWMEADGELVGIRQMGFRDGNYAEVLLPADRVLLFSWKRTGSNYAGFSNYRAAHYWWLIQREMLKALGIGTSREALGIPVVTVAEGAKVDDAKVTALRKWVQNLVLHESASVVLPQGFDFEWVTSSASNKEWIIKGILAIDTVIKGLFFAQGTSLGTNETGNRAVGEVHEDIQERFLNGVIRVVEDVVNGVEGDKTTGLVRKIIDPNWGPQKRYPQVRLVLKQSDVPVAALSSATTSLIGAKALTWRHQDENTVRERLGLELIDEQERQKLLDEAQERAAELAKAMPEKNEGPPAQKNKASNILTWQPKRQPRHSERFLAAAEIDGFLNTARDDFERDVKDIAEDMVRRALPELRKALADGDPSDVADIKLDAAGVEAYVRGFVEKARRYGAKTVRAERKRAQADALLKERREGDQTLAPTPLRAAEEGEEEEDDKKVDSIDRHEVVDRVEKVVRAQTNLVTNRVVNRVRQEVEREAIDLVNRGGQVEEIVDRVAADLVESHVLRNDAGIVLTRSFSLGREEAAAEFGEEVATVEYSALLDGRQCIACDRADGKTADFGSPEHDELVPPNKDCDGGSNCRCILVYVFKTPGFRKEEDA